MKRKLLLAMLFVASAIGFNANAQTVGDEFIVGKKTYVVAGSNLIANGSFDDGKDNWYNGVWTKGSIDGSSISSTGGYDGGAYITISAGGAGAASTLRNVIPVESGKTYLFRCYTSGQTPTRNNSQYSGLWKGTGDGGKTESDQLYRLQWGAKNAGSTSKWTVNNFVFTADGSYTHVVIRSSWNSNVKLDGFFLGEVSEQTSLSTQALGSWTGDDLGSANAQHWSGTTTAYYDNASWWASSTKEKKQNVNLPVGAYVLRGIGRANAADGTDTYMSIDGKTIFFYSKGDSGLGVDTSGEENFSSSGTYANNNNGRGWEVRNIPLIITTAKEVEIKMGYMINYTSKPTSTWSWASICAPELYKTDITTAMMMPLLSESITEAQIVANMNAHAASEISSELTVAQSITLSSDVDDALTAYNNLVEKIPVAREIVNRYKEISEYLSFSQSKVPGDYSSITTAIEAGDYATVESGILAIKNVRNNIKYSVAADKENITQLIDNNGFELGNTNYWTVGSSSDTGARSTSNDDYSMENSEGDYLFNTWWKGIPLTQNLGVLPAGTYTLISTVASDGATIYLLINDNHDTYIETTDKTKGLTLYKTFTLDAATEVTIGVVGGEDGTAGEHKGYTPEGYWWYKADNFRLFKGDINIGISEDDDYTPAAMTANVTLNRTIKADTWNTFVVPFAINNTDLKAAFGADVSVAEYSEVADGDNSTVSFTTMETPAVAANTPVLLKTSKAGTSYTFLARTIVVGGAKVAGTNFDFVGNYNASLALENGDYFISANNLYKKGAGATVTLKGTRAYIQPKSVGVKILNFVIDDEIVTGVDSVEAAEAEEEGVLYNTAGQVVTEDYKGIVIKNGKKYYQK